MLLPAPLLVFTNVDAALDRQADRDAWTAAARTLKQLERESVPLILCSSRTRAEIEGIQQALEIRHPFVCENGSAAFVPAGYFPFPVPEAREVAGYHAIELGHRYPEVVEALRRTAARQKIDIVGFSDLSVDEVARDCHLPLLQARLAKLREYGERFRLIDPDAARRVRLFQALNGVRLRCVAGDPYHDVGAAVDTRLAVSRLYALFQHAHGAVLSLGSSDATAPFSERLPALGGEAHRDGSALVEWAELLVDSVVRLRERESHVAR